MRRLKPILTLTQRDDILPRARENVLRGEEIDTRAVDLGVVKCGNGLLDG